MIIDFIEYAYNFVNDFKYMNVKTKSYNKFDFEYKVPAIRNISKYEWSKDLSSVKPNTLNYIIYYLQNAETKIIIDSIVAYLYYWKIRKADSKTMHKQYKQIKSHYTASYTDNIPLASTTGYPVVYSVSFNVGEVRINKFGLTVDPTRYKKMISDIKTNYELVNVGNFQVHQEIQFDEVEQAEAFEQEAIKNLKKHPKYQKCKFFFDGYSESYLHIA